MNHSNKNIDDLKIAQTTQTTQTQTTTNKNSNSTMQTSNNTKSSVKTTPFKKLFKPIDPKHFVIKYQAQSKIFEKLEDFAAEALPEVLGGAMGLLLDYPTNPVPKTPTPKMQNNNLSVGSFSGTPLRANPSAMTRTDENHFKVNKMETVMDLARVPTATLTGITNEFTIFPTWSTLDAPGKNLYYMKVGPAAEVADWFGDMEAGYIVPTALTYCSIPWKNWSGSITYEIDVFASAGFHHGALRVAFHPGVFDPSNLTSVADNSSQYFADLNLSDNKTKFIVNVPYMAPYPALMVCNSNQTETAAEMRNYFTGLLSVSVAKKLVSTSAASSTIKFAVRVAAGEDFKLFNATNHNQSITLAPNVIESIPFRTQSDDVQSASDAQAIDSFNATQYIGGTTLDEDIEESRANVNEHTSQTPSARTSNMMPERPWTLAETGGKFIQFANVTALDTAVPGTILGKWSIPNDINRCEIQNINKNRFTYTRFESIIIDMKVAGTPFQSGAFWLGFVPLVHPDNFTVGSASDFISTAAQADFIQHIIVEPHSDATNLLTLKFIHPQEYLNLKNGDSIGTLLLMVYSQLDATTTAQPPVDIMLSTSTQESEVFTPRPCVAAPEEGLKTWVQYKTQSKTTVTSRLNAKKAPVAAKSNVNVGGVDHAKVETKSFPKTKAIPSEIPDTIFLGKAPSQQDTLEYSDSSFAHMEDTNPNLQELIKKFSSSLVISVEANANTPTQIEIDVLNDLIFPAGQAGGNKLCKYGSGFLGWYGSMFRGFRGDIRAVIVAQIRDNNNDVINTHFAINYDTLKQEGGFGTDHDYSIGATGLFPDSNTYGTPRLPSTHYTILSNAEQEVMKLEIPMTTLGGFSIPPVFTSHPYEPYSSGALNISLQHDNKDTVIMQLSVFTAAADAATLGIPWMIPRITGTYNQHPDRFLAP